MHIYMYIQTDSSFKANTIDFVSVKVKLKQKERKGEIKKERKTSKKGGEKRKRKKIICIYVYNRRRTFSHYQYNSK